MAQIEDIYHSYNGVERYRNMTVYLARRGYDYSPTTIHKYMNIEFSLRSVIRPKKTAYEHGRPHKVFENKLNRNFKANKISKKWYTDLYEFRIEDFAYIS